MKVLWLAIVCSIYFVNADKPVLKESVKHFYTHESKLDIMKLAASKVLGKHVVEKLQDPNLSIALPSNVSVKVKDFLENNHESAQNVKALLNKGNVIFDTAKVEQTIKRHSDVLFNTFNSLSLQCESLRSSNNMNLQIIFEQIKELHKLIITLGDNFNNFTNEELLEKTSELIVILEWNNPDKKIMSAMGSLSIDLIHPLLTKMLPNGLCGSEITKTQAVMQFFDFIMLNVVECQTFLFKCYQLKEEMNTKINLTAKKNGVLKNIENHIETLYKMLLKNVNIPAILLVPDVPIGVDSPTNACIMDFECNFKDTTCHLEDLNLQDEWAPFTITSTQNIQKNDDITTVIFEPNCTLTFIPNSIFKIFPNLKTLKVSSTKLPRIEPDFFKNANNLKEFYCSNNKLTKLVAGTFVEAPKLEKIELQLNKIQDIEHKAFTSLLELKSLDLKSNVINFLAYSVFQPLTKLNQLSLAQNTCTNKNFDDLNGILTSIEEELEKNTKCGLNDYMRNIRSHQIGSKSVLDVLQNKLGAVEASKPQKENKMEERMKIMEDRFKKHEDSMRNEIKILEDRIRKLKYVPDIDSRMDNSINM